MVVTLPVPQAATNEDEEVPYCSARSSDGVADSCEEVNEACCLAWALSHCEHALVEEGILARLHDEIESCAVNLEAVVLEENATSGTLMRTRAHDDGPSAEDSIVRLGQLLCRWAAQQDPPLGLRVGVHTGRLHSLIMPSGVKGYFGEGLGTARTLADHAPKDAVVHLSNTTKRQLVVLEQLSFSCTPSKISYYLEPWTQVVESRGSATSAVCTTDTRTPTTEFPMMYASSPKHRSPRTPVCFEELSQAVGEEAHAAAEGYASETMCSNAHAQVEADPKMSLDEFREYLTSHGVDVYQYGKNQAKTLPDFYKRVMVDRKSRLCSTAEGGLEQHMALVRINLICRSSTDERDYQLWLNSEIMKDGRARGRIQKLAYPICGSSWEEAVKRCFTDRFQLDPALLGEVLQTQPESYSYNSERTSSQSTPGIMTTYMTHEVTVRVTDPKNSELEKIGLPEMTPFTTGSSSVNGEEYNWAWQAVGEDKRWQDALCQLLVKHGIQAEKFTPDALAELWDEVYGAKYATLSVREDFVLERRINIVKVWLCSNILSLEHVLVRKWEVEKGERNMSCQDRPVAGRCMTDEAWEHCVVETLEDKLGLDKSFQRQQITLDERSYRLSEEIGYSSKYPGLRTLYCIHEVRCQINDLGCEGLDCLGLPDGDDFTVNRIKKNKKSPESGRSTHSTRWAWKPLTEVMYSSQSFQHGLVDQPTSTNEKHGHKRRLRAPSPPRLPEEFTADGGSSSSQSGCHVLQGLMRGKRPNLDRALNAAKKIRDANYTCRQFFDDCSKSFPELALYVTGADDENAEPLSSSGRTLDDEYQRTMGALFAFYWLMRRSTDGAQSFCFGVDNDWNPLSENSSCPSRSPEELEKRKVFLEQTRWEDFEQLLIDAGLLKKDPDSAEGITHDVERTLAMLVLTAIHDIMKVKALLPVDEDGEKISDHDAALAFVLENYPDVLPSFAMLPRSSRQSVKFTQCKMEYNMGWLVQAEAPPGALFRKFKQVISAGLASEPDVAFYFVHWLTDLAGAEPCPQEGCEKFVLKFPQRVLASVLSSFSIVKHLTSRSETEVLEDYLVWRWKQTEESNCGPPPTGSGSVALLRLVIMAQGDSRRILNAFQALQPQDREQLEIELAITGCEAQCFQCESSKVKFAPAGPAILIYYAPAFMQKAGAVDPLGTMTLLADIFRQARILFPLQKSQVNETVTIRIDTLKDLQVPAIQNHGAPGEVWLLQRTSYRDAQVQHVNLMRQKDQQNIDWEDNRVLFEFAGTRSMDSSLPVSRCKTAKIYNSDGSEAGEQTGRRGARSQFSPAARLLSPASRSRRASTLPEETRKLVLTLQAEAPDFARTTSQ